MRTTLTERTKTIFVTDVMGSTAALSSRTQNQAVRQNKKYHWCGAHSLVAWISATIHKPQNTSYLGIVRKKRMLKTGAPIALSSQGMNACPALRLLCEAPQKLTKKKGSSLSSENSTIFSIKSGKNNKLASTSRHHHWRFLHASYHGHTAEEVCIE